jgi:hypothetical protein
MVKLLIQALLIYIFVASTAIAQVSTFTLDKILDAPFPSRPIFVGEFGIGTQRMKNYQHLDHENTLVYSATLDISETRFKSSQAAEVLDFFIQGQLISLKGKLIDARKENIKGVSAIIFQINFTLEGIEGRKFGIVGFKNGGLYSWTLQDVPAISRLDAQAIFYNHLSNFNIR